MFIFKKIDDLTQQLEALRKAGKTIAFVPTMGALHEGHFSLIHKAQDLADITVCSIFVNPTQFNDKEDFEKYPLTIDTDIEHLIYAKTTILFLPAVDEIYPPGQSTIHYPLGFVETILEGAFRPGHFQGVCQVVDRLLSIVNPEFLVMGQKDFQQTMVIKKLLEITHRRTALVIAPTRRESNGLAMSSRNTRLNSAQKEHAKVIHATLMEAKTQLTSSSWTEVRANIAAKLQANGFEKYDYIALCKASDLSEVNSDSHNEPLIILIAAYIGNVRLIDNTLI